MSSSHSHSNELLTPRTPLLPGFVEESSEQAAISFAMLPSTCNKATANRKTLSVAMAETEDMFTLPPQRRIHDAVV